MTAKITVRVEGVQALLRDLRDDPIHAKPWNAAVHKAGALAEKAMRYFAPGVETKRKIKTAYGKGPVIKWGAARMPNRLKGTGKKKVRVFGALHGSKRVKFHYRSGQFRGQLTRDWFEKARASVREKIVALISKAEREIEAAWRR